MPKIFTMHLLNMPQIYQETLNRANTALISAKVLLYIRGYKIVSLLGGIFQYDINDKENHCFDVTKAIKNDKVIINKSIPELPTFDGAGSITQYSNVKLQLQKLFGDFWQYVGQGAGITDLITSSVEISAVCENMPDLPLFKGTIRTAPDEDYDTVTFDVRASLWDIVGKELQTNQYNTAAFTVPGSGVVTETVNTYLGVTTPDQDITYHCPIIMFDELGQSKVLVKASDAASVDLLQVTQQYAKPAKLGKYSLKWLNDTSVEFTTPTTGTTVLTHPSIMATGTLSLTLPTLLADAVGIYNISLYVVNPVMPLPFTEIKGKTVDFWFSYTVEGNPISIVLDLLVRTITGNWNTATAITLDPVLPIDYVIFQEYENLFNFTRLYVSEWNDNNDVYSYKNDTKPIQSKNIAQKILDHIGCQLTYNTEGKISLNSNWFYVAPIQLWSLGSIHCGARGNGFTPSHSIKAGKEYKRFELFYGYNNMTKNAAGHAVEFAPDALVGIYGVNDKPATFTVTLPYYKVGVSDLIIAAITQYLWKWVQLSHIRLSANVLPQHGLSLEPGDKFMAKFDTSPILPNIDKDWGKYFMIYSISKAIGGEVQIECIATPEPIIPSQWCDAKWCMNSRWK